MQLQTNIKPWKILKSTVTAGKLNGAGVLIQRQNNKSRNLQDLTSFGNGRPMMEKLHGRSCELCCRLKSNILDALDQIEGVQH